MKSKIKEVRFAEGSPNQGLPESFVITLKNNWILDIRIDFQSDRLICQLHTGRVSSINSMTKSKSYSIPAPIGEESVFDIYYVILALLYKLGIDKPDEDIDDAIYSACFDYREYIKKYGLLNVDKNGGTL